LAGNPDDLAISSSDWPADVEASPLGTKVFTAGRPSLPGGPTAYHTMPTEADPIVDATASLPSIPSP
jgi:hypothetical protein